MKRYIKLLLAAVMLVTFLLASVGCDGITDINGGGSGGGNKTSFNRLTGVTIVDEDGSQSYSVSWSQNGCSFANDEGIFDFKFVDSTKTLILSNSDYELPIYDYDSEGRIALIYNEDDPEETFAVQYDQNGLPSIEGMGELDYDPATKKLKIGRGGGSSQDESGQRTSYTTYHVRTYGDNGMILSVDSLTVTTYSDGTTKEESKSDVEKYTYDQNGNMIKYENQYKQILFTYSDDKIEHQWERVVPVCYLDFFSLFDLPLYWNIK